MTFRKPIGYLERSDFKSNGDLKFEDLGNEYPGIFIMIQGSYCGACSKAKPAFQQLADSGIVTCMTIQLDGKNESEKQLAQMIEKIYPSLDGVPSYVLYIDSKTKTFYDGDRTVNDMKKFVLSQNTQKR